MPFFSCTVSDFASATEIAFAIVLKAWSCSVSFSPMSEGQRGYEAKRAAKAGVSLDKWMSQKDRDRKQEVRAREEAAALGIPCLGFDAATRCRCPLPKSSLHVIRQLPDCQDRCHRQPQGVLHAMRAQPRAW